MSEIPSDRRYTPEHEWAMSDPSSPGQIIVGITDYAQDHLGDIVLVELPELEEEIAKDSPFGTVESPKSVSDLFAPVSGRVVEVNTELEAQPELCNEDPYGDGWMIRIQVEDASELDELMDAEAYAELCESEED